MDIEQIKEDIRKIYVWENDILLKVNEKIDQINDFHEQKYKALCDRYVTLKLKTQSKEIDLTDLTVNDLLKLQDKIYTQLEERLQ